MRTIDTGTGAAMHFGGLRRPHVQPQHSHTATHVSPAHQARIDLAVQAALQCVAAARQGG